MHVEISDPILVHAPEHTTATMKWGVYSIPRLWRDKKGELVIRFNGEQDSANIYDKQQAPNLYFVSLDEGNTWEISKEGEILYDTDVITGIDPPYLTLTNGKRIFLRNKKNRKAIEGLVPIKQIKTVNDEAILNTYHYGDIPEACKGIEICEILEDGTILSTDIVYDFPEREVYIPAQANTGSEFIPIEQFICSYIWSSPYLSSLNELPDGTLAALAYGQNPLVPDRYCPEVYLVVSEDEGKTWCKRATVASGINEIPYGYGGDGGEVSLTVDKNGSLHVVMRMETSVNPDRAKIMSDTMYAVSYDGGFTWTKPVSLSASSVTPHIKTLDGGVLVVIFGRPGVHCKFSYDNGKTWSQAYSLIGKTLEEELEAGRTEGQCKYFDTVSYSNTFVEMLKDGSLLVLYNNLKYPDKNGENTKAAFVVKIKAVQ